MIFLKIIKCIVLIVSMVLTLVCFVGDDIKEMCFFGIISIWNLMDMAHDNIIDKLK